MKITKEQYEKAKEQLPKLEKAKTLVESWESAMKANSFEGMDVLAIESEDGSEWSAKVRPKKLDREAA